MPKHEPEGASRSDVERNRRALLDAASDALAQNPGASIAQVARAAGLARSTVYRHFSSRQELLQAMRGEALIRAADAIAVARVEEGTALEALRRTVDALVSHGLRFRVLLLEGVDLDPAFLRERGEALAPLNGLVLRGQAAGLIRSDLPPEWVVAAFASLLTAGVRRASGAPADDREIADLVFSTLTAGVATAP